jgi:heavy metal efflux system protein
MPGMTFSFTQPMAMRLDEVVSGVKADMAVKIFGPDMAVLERLGRQVLTRLTGVEGLADLQVESLFGATQLEVVVDPGAAARYGLSVSRIQEVVEAATGGATATQLLDGGRRFPILVRLPAEFRTGPDAMATLPILAPGGERLTLAQVADVRQVAAQEAIAHERGERRIVVQGNARGRDIGSVVADAQQRLAALSLPTGYYIEWGGQFENQARATARLLLVVPLSLAVIFLVLFVAFGSTRQALLIILNVPFALIGGIAALWVRGMTLNLSASVGFIALFGIAVTDGIVLIAAINQLRANGSSLRDAVVANQTAGSEVQRPLATVVIGGVMTSTLLTLLVLPVVYGIIERRVERRTHASAAR